RGRTAMVSEGPQHAGEVRHAGAAASKLLGDTRREDLARLERSVILGDEGIGFVVGAAPAGEFAAELVCQIRPLIRWELEHGVLLVGGIIHPERSSKSVGIPYIRTAN